MATTKQGTVRVSGIFHSFNEVYLTCCHLLLPVFIQDFLIDYVSVNKPILHFVASRSVEKIC